MNHGAHISLCQHAHLIASLIFLNIFLGKYQKYTKFKIYMVLPDVATIAKTAKI